MAHNRQWFTFKNMDGETPELFIFDDIDDWWGVSAQSIIDQIRDIDATDINVRINSRGGMVFEGIAIYNVLRLHKANIHVSIEGLAASIASVIAMAGDTITMAENAMMMIHNPYGWASGDAEAMRKTADVMDKVADSIAVSYTARTGKTLDEMKALMDDETWFTAADALDLGLVDQVDTPVQAAASACFDLSRFQNTPEGWGKPASPEPVNSSEEEPEEPEETPEAEPESNNEPVQPENLSLIIANLCNEAGYPEKTAAFLKEELTEDQVKNQLSHFAEIKNLCATANHSDKAKAYIDSGKTPEQVRNSLFELMTKDEKEIDTRLTPKNQGLKSTASIDTQAIYQKRNKK